MQLTFVCILKYMYVCMYVCVYFWLLLRVYPAYAEAFSSKKPFCLFASAVFVVAAAIHLFAPIFSACFLFSFNFFLQYLPACFCCYLWRLRPFLVVYLMKRWLLVGFFFGYVCLAKNCYHFYLISSLLSTCLFILHQTAMKNVKFCNAF